MDTGFLANQAYFNLGTVATAGAPSPFFDGDVRLFTDNITPSKASLFADFTEPTFAGYAPVAYAAFVDGLQDEAGNHPLQSPLISFVCTAVPAAPELIYGIFLADGLGTGLVGAIRFAAPVTIDQIGDFIKGLVSWYPDNGVFGWTPIP